MQARRRRSRTSRLTCWPARTLEINGMAPLLGGSCTWTSLYSTIPVMLSYGEAGHYVRFHRKALKHQFKQMEPKNALRLAPRCTQQEGFKALYVRGTVNHVFPILRVMRTKMWPYMIRHWNEFPSEAPKFPAGAENCMTLRYHLPLNTLRLANAPTFCTICWNTGHYYYQKDQCSKQHGQSNRRRFMRRAE